MRLAVCRRSRLNALAALQPQKDALEPELLRGAGMASAPTTGCGGGSALT